MGYQTQSSCHPQESSCDRDHDKQVSCDQDKGHQSSCDNDQSHQSSCAPCEDSGQHSDGSVNILSHDFNGNSILSGNNILSVL